MKTQEGRHWDGIGIVDVKMSLGYWHVPMVSTPCKGTAMEFSSSRLPKPRVKLTTKSLQCWGISGPFSAKNG